MNNTTILKPFTGLLTRTFLILITLLACSKDIQSMQKNSLYNAINNRLIITAQELAKQGATLSFAQIEQLYQNGHLNTLNMLLPYLSDDCKMFLDLTIDVGNTTLEHSHYWDTFKAVRNGNIETLQQLLYEHYDQMSIPDEHGKTFLDHAIEWKQPEIAEYLYTLGASQIKTSPTHLVALLREAESANTTPQIHNQSRSFFTVELPDFNHITTAAAAYCMRAILGLLNNI